ncbi:hypothetical protein BDF19DRAFT_448826 [Syncephalis fuscata]|nr:hypothetical protein BDF19DRAFT_448826 [Syncephalis fuscata]
METDTLPIQKLAGNPPSESPKRSPPTLPRKSPARSKVFSLEKPLPPLPAPDPSEMLLLTPPYSASTLGAHNVFPAMDASLTNSTNNNKQTDSVQDLTQLTLNAPPNSAITSPTLLVTPTESDAIPATIDGDVVDDLLLKKHTRHLKRRSMLHRPYEGVKLASELESVRVVSYERREMPQPYAIYRIYEDFTELSIRLAYTFNLDASSTRPLAPLLESFTRAQQRNADVPFDMMDQLDNYVARLVASDQQLQQSRPMREFFGIWRSDVNYKLSRSIVDPLARTFAQRTTIPVSGEQEGSDYLDARWSNAATSGSRTPPMTGKDLNSATSYSSDDTIESPDNTSPTFSAISPRLGQSIRQLQHNKSVNKLVQRAKTVLVRKRAASESREDEEEVAAVAAAATLRRMHNGSAGVVAIAAPWNPANTSQPLTTDGMPRLVRLGSLNAIPRQLDPVLTRTAPWNRKFSHDDTESRPRISEETARMATNWHIEPVGLTRSQSLREQNDHISNVPRLLPIKPIRPRKKLDTIRASDIEPPTPEAAANEPTSPKMLSSDAENELQFLALEEQSLLKFSDIVSDTSDEIRPPSGSAMAAVAMRVNDGNEVSGAEADAIRKPLVRAITIAGLRRKRTLEMLKQDQDEKATESTDISKSDTEADEVEEQVQKAVEKVDKAEQAKPIVTVIEPKDEPTKETNEIKSPQPELKTKPAAVMDDLRQQLPLFSPLSPDVPITPYTGKTTPANNSNVTEVPIFGDTSAIMSSNVSWRSRSADSSPVNPIHSTPVQTPKGFTSMTAALLTAQNGPNESTETFTGLLRHHRSQPAIRDSVLIRRTDTIAPRPTPAQLARARTIAHSPSSAFLARRNKAHQVAATTNTTMTALSKTATKVSEVGLVDAKVVLDKARLIKLQIPRQITYDELRVRIEEKFERCGHGSDTLKDRILVYREPDADGAIVRLEGDFALGVVLFECPDKVTFFAV